MSAAVWLCLLRLFSVRLRFRVLGVRGWLLVRVRSCVRLLLPVASWFRFPWVSVPLFAFLVLVGCPVVLVRGRLLRWRLVLVCPCCCFAVPARRLVGLVFVFLVLAGGWLKMGNPAH
jgi:hypothetical protein